MEDIRLYQYIWENHYVHISSVRKQFKMFYFKVHLGVLIQIFVSIPLLTMKWKQSPLRQQLEWNVTLNSCSSYDSEDCGFLIPDSVAIYSEWWMQTVKLVLWQALITPCGDPSIKHALIRVFSEKEKKNTCHDGNVRWLLSSFGRNGLFDSPFMYTTWRKGVNDALWLDTCDALSHYQSWLYSSQ